MGNLCPARKAPHPAPPDHLGQLFQSHEETEAKSHSSQVSGPEEVPVGKHKAGSPVHSELGATKGLPPDPAQGPAQLLYSLCSTLSVTLRSDEGQVKTPATPPDIPRLCSEASSDGLNTNPRVQHLSIWSTCSSVPLPPAPVSFPFLANENIPRPSSCSFSLYQHSGKTTGPAQRGQACSHSAASPALRQHPACSRCSANLPSEQTGTELQE